MAKKIQIAGPVLVIIKRDKLDYLGGQMKNNFFKNFSCIG